MGNRSLSRPRTLLNGKQIPKNRDKYKDKDKDEDEDGSKDDDEVGDDEARLLNNLV